MWKEFQKFIQRGNILDLAVGVILGSAFGKIISSLVDDVLMPPIGLLIGKVDFSDLYINLSTTSYDSLAEAKAAGAATINYGMFLNSVINFLIIAFCIFLFIRQVNKVMKEPEKKESVTEKECPACCSTVPVQATRCPYCTSYIEEAEEEPATT